MLGDVGLVAAVLLGLAGPVLRRPAWSVYGAIVLWILVPHVAAPAFTGMSNNLHPASITVIVAAVTSSGGTPRVGAGANDRLLQWIMFSQYFALALIVTSGYLAGGWAAAASPAILNQFVAPFLAFSLVVRLARRGEISVIRLRNLTLSVAVAEAIYSFVQAPLIRAGRSADILYSSWYSRQEFFSSLERPLGTLDHPLVLGLLLASAVPLVAGLRSALVQVVVVGILIVGCAGSYSRAATFAGLFAIVFLFVRPRVRVGRRLVQAAALVAGVMIFIRSALGIEFQDRVDRLSNDDESTGLRLDAYRYFFDNWSPSFWAGDGVGSAVRLRDTGQLQSSLENPVLINILEIGLVATLLIFGAQVLLIARSIRLGSIPGTAMAASVCLVVTLTFSSTSTASACAPILWLLLAIASVPASADAQLPARTTVADQRRMMP